MAAVLFKVLQPRMGGRIRHRAYGNKGDAVYMAHMGHACRFHINGERCVLFIDVVAQGVCNKLFPRHHAAQIYVGVRRAEDLCTMHQARV